MKQRSYSVERDPVVHALRAEGESSSGTELWVTMLSAGM